MTKKERLALRRDFMTRLGPSAATFAALFETLPDVCFYMKDAEGRIMAINRRNRDLSNIKDESDAVGLDSFELFPSEYADEYLALDREVLRTGRPIIDRITPFPADRSLQLMVSNVLPLRDVDGKVAGTVRTFRLMPDDGGKLDRYGRIRYIAQYISEHFAENLKLEDLAAKSGMSMSSFKRAFAEKFDMTPWNYITTIRLNAARRLMEETDKLLSEIAAETGFFDQSHFTRVFKQVRGVTPGEYRRRHQ